VVVIVGAGGIGHPAIGALARADVTLRVIDDDRVEPTNLHRLPLARDEDVGTLKTDVIARELRAFGRTHDQMVVDRVTPETAHTLLEGAAVVVEGSDNFATKFLVADACALLGIPSVHGAALGWIGTVLSVLPGQTACYRCLFEDLPQGDTVDCSTAGVYGPVTSVIGALMAADAERLATGEHAFAGTIGSYDGWRNTFRTVKVPRRADCPLCGARTIRDLDASRYYAPLCAM
jgi:adenylyltransferase/sulfurtransferase